MNSKIKKISIGSANFGQRYTLNKIMLNQKEINKILDLAKNNRIICIDTAEAYKKSEAKIGNYIKNQNFKDWVITTKLTKNKKLRVVPKASISANFSFLAPVSFCHFKSYIPYPKFRD